MHRNVTTEDAEKLWNAPLFFANIILASNYCGPEISKTELKHFAAKYEEQYGHKISLKDLFSKFWLRNILGNIYIPSVIRKTVRDYNDKETKHHELLFIRHLKTRENISEASSTEIDSFIKDYESSQSVSLDSDWLFKSYFLKNKKGDSSFKINGVEYYSKLLDNWSTFKFISEFLDYKQKKYDISIVVTKTTFDEIYTRHQALYPNLPILDTLIDEKILADTPQGYSFPLHSGYTSYIFDLAGKIKAIIWQKLLDDLSFENDTQRLLRFLSISKYDEHRQDIIPNLSERAKERFKDAALQLVLNEPDLLTIDQEFDKVYLDEEIHSPRNWNFRVKNANDDLKPTEDVYELYNKMLKVSDNHSGNLFYIQHCRGDLSYLVDELLQLDKQHSKDFESKNFKYPHYPITKLLLKEGLTKPYLLWKTAYYLNRKGLLRLPYLLIEKNYESFSFKLLDSAEIEVIPYETESQVRTKVLKIAIELIYDEITSLTNYDENIYADITFQLFKEINRDKFDLIRNFRTVEIYEQSITDKKNREKVLLGTIEAYSVNESSFPKKHNPTIISKHLSLLLAKVGSYLPKRDLSNGSWQLPIYKLDYLSWLSKVSINCQAKKEKLETNISQEIAKTFLSIYQSAIQKTSITKTVYPSLKQKTAIPSWYLDNEQLENIDWVFPFVLLKKNSTFLNFLNPSIDFNSDEDKYDDLNRYSVRRLRSHLFILLSTLNFINNQNLNQYRIQKDAKSIKNKLETTIVYILKNNTVQHVKNKIDILDEVFERGYNKSSKNELIPQIANSINWFTDKKGILNALTKTSDLIRLLIIIDWITAEGLKKELIKKFKKSKITDFIKSSSFNPEIELLISKLTHQPKLIEQTQRALDYWKKNVISHSEKDLARATYLVDLMAAYNGKDESALDAIKVPEHKSYRVHREFDVNNYKQFYRGLIRFSTNPESAYQIFNNLYNQFPKHSSVALNRFASKINWASKTKTPALFEEALEEWNEMKPGLPDSYLENIKDNVWTNQLTAYYHLNDKIEFDKLYLSIPYPYQMKQGMIELRIGMLLKNQLREEAKRILYKATDYHKDSGGRIPKFIKKLKNKLDDKTDIKFLQNNYNEIFASQPKTLIQIFPDRLNAENKLGSFIAKEVALASSKMLDKINAVRDVGLEDKYNDLVQLGLDARITQWGWQVKDQARGAFSGNKKKYNPGERDILVSDSNGDSLIVCEAFIWKNKQWAESHIQKVFNYNHKRNNFIILIYDKRLFRNLDSSWNKYKNDMLLNRSYPIDFTIKKSKWKELTNRFGYKSSAIKIGCSVHGKDTKIFHIMVNLDYRVT